MGDAVQQFFAVKAKIDAAEREAGREAGAVTLVAVSKTFDAADIGPVIEAGQRVFGENRVQEAQAKWPDLKEAFPGIE
ncbi:MAG: YggS family pyridoxal phosphate-dependent enzyme, partial [Mesorhizobium sp.]